MKNMDRSDRERLKTLAFLGLGIEMGQSLKGPALGPAYFRQALKTSSLPLNIEDLGDVVQDSLETAPKIHSLEDLGRLDTRAYQEGYQKIRQHYAGSRLPLLNFGGDHSLAISTLGAFIDQHPQGQIVWIDAHADINTPASSPTGNLHGMPLSILMSPASERPQNLSWLENQLSASQIIYLGLRDLDPFEVEYIRSQNICCYDMQTIRRRGALSVAQEVFRRVEGQPLHISLDIDGLDPELAPATGVRAEGGLLLSEALDLASVFSSCPELKSIDIVELNPLLGTDSEVRQTLAAALMVLLKLLGTELTVTPKKKDLWL